MIQNHPVITLVRSSSITLDLGDTYTEQGASAFDVVDGTIDVQIIGTVNTSAIGDYKLIYIATDNSGNSATVERIINVAP